MKIESDIPIPPRRYRRNEAGETARALKVGESVFCETETKYNTVRKALHDMGRKSATRMEGVGWRVWRTA